MASEVQALKERIDELEAGLAEVLEGLEGKRSPDQLAEAIRALTAQRPVIQVNPTPVQVNVPPPQTTGKWQVTVHGVGGRPDQKMTIERTA
jgi:hypothetical protein